MNNIIKYLAFVFLINNIVFSIAGFYEFAEFFFLIFMGGSLLITLYSVKILKHVVFDRSFILFFILNFLNLVYYIFIELGDIESFKYLSARFVQFSVFSISIYTLKDDFPVKFIKLLKLSQ